MKFGFFMTWLIGATIATGTAHAQIYGGVTDSGSIFLSNNQDDNASLLIVNEVVQMDLIPKGIVAATLPSSIPEKFIPFINEASTTYRLPAALIHAVIAVESNYNPHALSPKGAQGLMQLMPATARRFGVVNSFDPRVNILAGSHYLRWLMDFFQQDLELTVAAYNAGEMAIIQAGRKIPKFTETEKYVPKVLALYKKALLQI